MYKKLFKINIDKMIKKKDVDGLIEALQHKEIQIRMRAAEALEHLGWVPQGDLQEAKLLLAKGDWDDLPKLGVSAIEPLLQAMKDEDKDVLQNAEVAFMAIVRSRPPGIVDLLIQALNDHTIKHKAAEALGELGDLKALEPLLQSVRYEKPLIIFDANNVYIPTGVEKAIAAMGEHAVAPLLQTLKSNTPIARETVTLALGIIGHSMAVEPLIKILKYEDDVFYKDVASLSLSLLGEPAVEPLLQLIKEKPAPFTPWNYAVKALGRIGDKRAVEPLLEHVSECLMSVGDTEKNSAIRVATDALGWIGDERGIKTLIRVLEERRGEAGHALGRIGGPALESLLQFSTNDDSNIRMKAVEGLGYIKEDKAIEALIQALDDKSFSVRLNAENALVQIGKMALPALRHTRMEHPDYREKSIKSTLESIEQVS